MGEIKTKIWFYQTSAFKFNNKPGTFTCKRTRCKTCPFISNTVNISGPNRSVKVTDHFTCISSNVIYCITCTLCKKIYIGETVWRSIPAKIQCCILHSTFRILSYVCFLTSEFTVSSFNFPRATFKFLPCTFNFSYAIFKFTFKFSGLHFQVFAFNVEHLPIKFLLSTFDFTYFTCKFALYIQLFKLYFSSASHPSRVIGGLN